MNVQIFCQIKWLIYRPKSKKLLLGICYFTYRYCRCILIDFTSRLLSKNRKYIETHCVENDNVWQYHEPSEILETVCILGERTIFPMLSALRLYDEKYDRIQALLRHCAELHKLRQL